MKETVLCTSDKADSQLNTEVLTTSTIFLPANNFKKQPTQEQLSIYAIGYLSDYSQIDDVFKLPHGIRIKNLFDNHVWILNNCVIGNDRLFMWVDFGIDKLSVADNNGQLGTVSGSQEKLYGHIDVSGKITINGLNEELESIYMALTSVSAKIDEKCKLLNERVNKLDLKIRQE